MARPKLRTAELRERVLTAALATLTERGVGGLTARGVAQEAATSVPAVYELFGDKAGVVRAIFFAGFFRLGDALDGVPETSDPRRDLVASVAAFRAFARAEPALTHVMFGRPFADFDPAAEDRAAGAAVRGHLVRRVRRVMGASRNDADVTDAAHVVLALAQGLAVQESAGWLGTSAASVERRWRLGIEGVLDGLTPSPR